MSLKHLIVDIKKDLGNSDKRLFLKFLKKLLLSNSFKLLLNYRLGNYFHKRGNFLICRFLKHRQIKRHSCEISYIAQIGKNLGFPHPIGIVIGDGVIIGDNVKIWQHVTLGSHGKKNKELIYPQIRNDVRIYAGSMIIGNVIIGESSIIGAMSLVTKDVSPFQTAVGIPAKQK